MCHFRNPEMEEGEDEEAGSSTELMEEEKKLMLEHCKKLLQRETHF